MTSSCRSVRSRSACSRNTLPGVTSRTRKARGVRATAVAVSSSAKMSLPARCAVPGTGEDEALRLARGERDRPYIEQVAVGPPLDADRVRLLAEVLHVKVSGARLRAGPDRQRREPDGFPRDAHPLILDGKRQAGRE